MPVFKKLPKSKKSPSPRVAKPEASPLATRMMIAFTLLCIIFAAMAFASYS